MTRYISWNVNGLRAVEKKGFSDIAMAFGADCICLQETKLQARQTDLALPGYESSWSYAEIGQALAKIPGATEHPFYGEWVSGYSSPEYHAANRELIELTEQLAEGLSEAQLQHLVNVFVNCSRYELLFWDMSWEMKL